MANSTVVIKVKYGDVLRRFNAQELGDFTMGGLRLKVLSLFNFTPDTLLKLTYTDEDGDEVTLVDDDDLREVVRQGINPLRITVKLNNEKKSPRVHQPLQNLKPNVNEILKSVPEPIHDTVKKFLTELKSKVSSSAPVIPELVDHFSKMGLSYLDQLSNSRPEEQSNAHNEGSESNKNQESSKVDPSTSKEPPLERHKGSGKYIAEKTSEVKLGNVGTAKVDPTKRTFPPSSRKLPSSPAQKHAKLGAPVSHPPHMPRCVFRDGRRVRHGPATEIPFSASPVGNRAPYSDPERWLPWLTDVEIGNLKALSSKAPRAVNVGKPCVDSLGEVVGVDPNPRAVPVSLSQEKMNNINSTIRSESTKMAAPVSYPPHVTTYVTDDGVWMGPRPVNDVSSAFTPCSSSQIRTFNQNDGSVNFSHQGVQCDGCGVNPITGLRFKSKVKADYDLCGVCFEKMGNDYDYIRIDLDWSVAHQRPSDFNELHGTAAMQRAQATIRHGNAGPVVPKLDSCFVQDVTIMDGKVMAPLTPFTKIWLMRNNGTCVWPQKTQLVWVGGDKLTNTLAIDIKEPPSGLQVGMAVNVAVDFIAPETAGRYISYWRMASPTGQKFGQRIWVHIEVNASVKSQRESVLDFNLKLSPPSNSLAAPEIINMELKPVVEGTRSTTHSQPRNSNDTMEVGEPVVDVKPNNEQHEKKFPINDSLLVGAGGGSHSFPSAPPSSVSYPEIDFSEVAPVFPPPPPSIPLQTSSQQVPQKNEVEDKLLTELEAMGFKQVYLNKEVLRNNGYSLQQSVDDLCNVYEWDPMLEELHEMGFNNTQLNKKLLEKNDGIISRVVMDLISRDQQ